MKILFINDYATMVGGAERMTFDLCDELRRGGHEVKLFSSRAGLAAGEASPVDYTCWGTLTGLRTPLQAYNLDAYRQLRSVLRDFQPDVIHAKIFLTQISPSILPLLRNFPTVYHAVWYRVVCPTGLKMLPDRRACHDQPGPVCVRQGCLPARDWPLHKAQRALLWRGRGVFDAIVANSQETRRKLAEGGFAPVEEIQIIWNGVREMDQLSVPGETPHVVFGGRLVPEKGVDLLLRAFSRVLRNNAAARLTICGDGPQRNYLEKLARALKIDGQTKFTGHVGVEEIDAISMDAWLQVVPSLWDEPFGNIMAEAMMRGTAVVASNAGGPREVIEDGATGALVAPGDVDAWTQTLGELLQDRKRCTAMGAAARAFAQRRLSLHRCAQDFGSLYAKLTVAASAQQTADV